MDHLPYLCRWWWWWTVFVVWLTDGRYLALFSAKTTVRDPHHHKSDTPQVGFETAQNLSSGFVEWSCSVVLTTTPWRHSYRSPPIKSNTWIGCGSNQHSQSENLNTPQNVQHGAKHVKIVEYKTIIQGHVYATTINIKSVTSTY